MSDKTRWETQCFDTAFLGENIRRFRNMRGLTQAELAQKLFVSHQTVSKWELGENTPDLTRFCELAQVLSVSLDALLSRCPSSKSIIDNDGTEAER